MFRVAATVIVTAILISAFWIFYFGISGAPAGGGPEVTASGEKWYQGRAINPYPLLAGRQASG